MSIRIVCISKEGGYHDDPHHAISSVGWVEDGTGKRGNSTREQVYNWIKDDNGVAYVTDNAGNKVYVQPKTSRHGTHFIQTVADGRESNNLLHLLECG